MLFTVLLELLFQTVRCGSVKISKKRTAPYPHRGKLLDFEDPRLTVLFGADFLGFGNPTLQCCAVRLVKANHTVRCGSVNHSEPHRTVRKSHRERLCKNSPQLKGCTSLADS